MVLLADFSIIRPEPGQMIWTTIIFLLFWFLMYKFAFKPISDALSKRSSDIQNSLDEAKKAREEVGKYQSEQERLIAEAREERAVMLKEAKETKEQIIAEAKERANADYNRKMDSAMQDIENQKLAAMTDLKNQVGKLSLDIAGKIIKKELSNNPDQVRYAQSLVDDINLN